MSKQNIGLIGILLFILVIVSIDLRLANAHELRAVLSHKVVSTGLALDHSVGVLWKQATAAEELSGALIGLLEV